MTRGGKPYIVQGVGGDKKLRELAARGGNSIRTWSTKGLGKILDEAQSLNLTVMTRQPWFWEGYLNYLMTEATKLGVLDLTRKHFERGAQAIQKQDHHELPGVCREIVQMFPAEQRDRVGSMIRSDVK